MSVTQQETPEPLPQAQPDSQAEEILVRLEADLDENGEFGRRFLEITAQTVRVLEANGVASLQIPIADIKSARNEPLVGGGRLEVTAKSQEIIPILSYSLTIAAKFSEAARGIEQLAKGEPLNINLKQERTRCVKCNRLLPEKDGICPACINRGKTFLRIAGFLKPYKVQVLALGLLSLLTTAVNLIPPFLQGAIIDKVLIAHANLPLLGWYMGIWFGVIVVATFAQVATGRLIAFLAGNIASDLRPLSFCSLATSTKSRLEPSPVASLKTQTAFGDFS
jgi:ATP-binding cassette subfamily B protein